MKKILVMMCLCLTVVISGCRKNKPNLDNMMVPTEIDYSMGFGIDFSVNDGELLINQNTENVGKSANTGLIIFVNGIPQLYTATDGRQAYIIPNKLESDSKHTFSYKLQPAVCQGDRPSNIIFSSILNPGIIDAETENYYISYEHSIMQIPSANIEEVHNYTSVEIKDISGKVADCERDESSGNMIELSHNGVQINRTVISQEDIEGILTVEIVAGCSGNYILSFWDGEKPIQIGESLFYRTQNDRNTVTKYDFQLDTAVIESLNNLFVVLSPENQEISKADVVKSPTIIIWHKDMNESTEPITSEATSSGTTEASAETSTDVAFTELEGYRMLQKICVGNMQYVLWNSREHTKQISNMVTAVNTLTGAESFFGPIQSAPIHNMNVSKSGITMMCIDDLGRWQLILLDDKLNLIYQGLCENLLTSVPKGNRISDGGWIEGDIFYFGFNNCVYSKNLISGSEQIECKLGEDDIVYSIVESTTKSIALVVGKTDCDKQFLGIYNRDTGEIRLFENRSIKGVSDDGNIVMMIESVGIYAPFKKYVEVYNCELDKILRLDTASSDETENSEISGDGRTISIEGSTRTYSVEW